MRQLQSQTFTVFFLILLLGCGQDRREEVTKRYPTGEKKEVRVYEGQGAEEELIERQTYARSGDLIRVEKVAKEDTLYYSDLNPELTNPEGLKTYLTGGAWTLNDQSTLSFQFTSDSLFMADGSVNGVPNDAWIHHIEYLTGGKKNGLQGGRILEHERNETDTLRVYPVGPDSSLIGPVSFKRVNRDVRQAARKHRKQQQRPETASQNVTLEPRGNQMMYNRGGFTVPADETVQLAFENTATSPSMWHNVIVLNKAPSEAVYQEVGQEAVRAGAVNDYVPDHPAVLAATPMSKPGETVSVTFRTPAEPGSYGFVCTYPGHWATMRGTMEVVPGVAR